MLDIMPSTQLIEHEWDKHGTCSGLSADDYFAKVRAAFTAVRIPDAFMQPKAAFTTSLDEIVSAFTAANPRIDRSALAVECKSELDEVRICLDKQLSPRTCGSDVRSACKGKVGVPPLR
jgi:ribonuclease T2